MSVLILFSTFLFVDYIKCQYAPKLSRVSNATTIQGEGEDKKISPRKNEFVFYKFK